MNRLEFGGKRQRSPPKIDGISPATLPRAGEVGVDFRVLGLLSAYLRTRRQ
jgi:hypothetical protein